MKKVVTLDLWEGLWGDAVHVQVEEGVSIYLGRSGPQHHPGDPVNIQIELHGGMLVLDVMYTTNPVLPSPRHLWETPGYARGEALHILSQNMTPSLLSEIFEVQGEVLEHVKAQAFEEGKIEMLKTAQAQVSNVFENLLTPAEDSE